MNPTVRPVALPADSRKHPRAMLEYWYFNGLVRTQDAGPTEEEYGFYMFVVQPNMSLLRWVEKIIPFYVFWGSLAVNGPRGGRYLVAESVGADWKTDADFAARSDSRRFGRWLANLVSRRPSPWHVPRWELRSTGGQNILKLDAGEFAFSLSLSADKAPALGEGTGIITDATGGRFNQYDVTRNRVEGDLRVGKTTHPIRGTGWFQHTWIYPSVQSMFNRALKWRWMNFHLDDGSDLCVGTAFDVKGELPDAHFAHVCDRDGKVTMIAPEVTPLTRQGNYEASWSLKVPSLGLDLHIVPDVQDQVIRSNLARMSFFEGLCSASGTAHGRDLRGHGYVELVGY